MILRAGNLAGRLLGLVSLEDVLVRQAELLETVGDVSAANGVLDGLLAGA